MAGGGRAATAGVAKPPCATGRGGRRRCPGSSRTHARGLGFLLLRVYHGRKADPGPSAAWLSPGLPKSVFVAKPAQSRPWESKLCSRAGTGLRGLSATRLFHQMWSNRPNPTQPNPRSCGRAPSAPTGVVPPRPPGEVTPGPPPAGSGCVGTRGAWGAHGAGGVLRAPRGGGLPPQSLTMGFAFLGRGKGEDLISAIYFHLNPPA